MLQLTVTDMYSRTEADRYEQRVLLLLFWNDKQSCQIWFVITVTTTQL